MYTRANLIEVCDWVFINPFMPGSCLDQSRSVICTYDSFKHNLLKHNIFKYILKESCWLRSNGHITNLLQMLSKNALATKIKVKSVQKNSAATGMNGLRIST